ncbi:hypothetical protein [Lysobacter brunescens]|uniref:Integron n=1 Tax=Lysobacter brunescens TaxID=262323 RepID=A0ABW2YIA0_9GAMM
MIGLRAAAFALAMGLPLAAASAPPSPPDRPVIVGEQEDLDACGSWAEVHGLNPKGDGFLAVRAGPGVTHAMRDRLREGDGLFVCGGSADGAWLSIVYPRKGQDAAECGVSSPVPAPRAYRGPCGWGWVRADWIRILAG